MSDGLELAAEYLHEMLRACDLAEAIDLEFGHTLILRGDVGRGDLWTGHVRKVLTGDWTAEEFAAQRRAMYVRAKALSDEAFARRKPRS